MLVQDILNDARLLFNDSIVPYRWSDAELIGWLIDALQELWDRRRTAFFVAGIVTAIPAAIAAVGDTVLVQDAYKKPLAHYLAYVAFLENTDDVSNVNLSQKHYDAFMKGSGIHG